jgi:hypothetical protein
LVLLVFQEHLALLDAKEKLAILVVPDLLVDQEIQDQLDLMERLADLGQRANVDRMEALAPRAGPDSLELRERLEIMEDLVSMELLEPLAKMASMDCPDFKDPKVKLAHLE